LKKNLLKSSKNNKKINKKHKKINIFNIFLKKFQNLKRKNNFKVFKK